MGWSIKRDVTMEQYVLQQIRRLAPSLMREVERRWQGGWDGAMAAGPGRADLLALFICSTDVAAG
jgi:hypothetical protein